jgi:hypothetical protein
MVKPASRAEIILISKGEAPQGLWCDSLGYQWNLAGAGFSGGAIAVTGTAGICGDSPVAGTVTIAKGLPTDVIATVNPGCWCNAFHENVLVWDKASGLLGGWV